MSELGEQLKQARINKKMSLEEVQELTKIQKRYLESIEEGEFDKLPGSFYTKAFVKSYAEAVGLNYDVLLEEYGHELPKLPQTVESFPPRRSRASIPSPPSGKFLSALSGILIFLIIIGIFAVIWMVSINKNNDAGKDNIREDEQGVEVKQNENALTERETEKSVDEKSVDKESNENKQDDDGEETHAPSGDGKIELASTSGDTSNFILSETDQFHVAFSFTGDSWLKIQDGSGKTVINQGFSNGQEKTFDFSKVSDVRIRIGNTSNMKMEVNGEQIELPSGIAAQTVKIHLQK
ncbi:hypothetical protein DCC39_01340 [Pueribacillus theae]|uniref:Cytoskeleton protein RodZ-like C-terminal domain-containing protein n=1 Tax=Pueribacillus theae TaxID=2171751 RepID=A0A2U1K7S5_9BACI|nr:helix-turn-helix domain-containing protein [Pueribacillus theae]PWA13566.1 hypothetical protein DCC39_01340 [Pueribacillus theae]